MIIASGGVGGAKCNLSLAIKLLTWIGASCGAAAMQSPSSRKSSTFWSICWNRDRVVSKDDLIASVWGGRIVSKSTLTSRINAVRKAVGDSGEEQRLIRTLARKGFRFVGDAREQDPAPVASRDRKLRLPFPTAPPSRCCPLPT